MSDAKKPNATAVSYQHSPNFGRILREAGLSLAVSTYQWGQVVLLSSRQDELAFEFHGFHRVMGIACRPECLAVATREQIWFLPNAPAIAPKVDPKNPYDACFLARRSHFTGAVQAHELRWGGEELWMVNTLFSCLCTIDPAYSFVPRWRPPFVTDLVAEDRCHLSGFAMVGNSPRFATAHGETNSPHGWREGKATGGCVIDIASGETLARGFAMPHSPRLHNGKLWLLDSGTGCLIQLDVATGVWATVARLPGYARGLALHGNLAFVGLSKIRETSVFGGVPIAERRNELKCGVAVVQLLTGELLATLEFQSTVDEIFDVVILPETRRPTIRGPHSDDEDLPAIWLAPPFVQ